MLMTRRDRIGLTALAIVALAGTAAYYAQRPSGATLVGDFDSLDALTLTDPHPGPPRPERPPVLPPADFGEHYGVTLHTIDSYVPVDGPFGGALPTTAPATGDRPAQQMLFARFTFRDPQATQSQDHAVRINGRPAGTMHFPHLSGANGGPAFGTALVDATIKRVSIDVGIATGPLIEVERMSIGDAASTIAKDAPAEVPMRMQSIEVARGGLLVHLKVNTAAAATTFADQSWLLQVFCRDGRVLGPTGYRPADGEHGTAWFSVDAKDVSYVAYRTRPYAWHALGEVDLPPMKEMPRPPNWRAPAATRPTLPPSPEVERRMRDRRAASGSASQPN